LRAVFGIGNPGKKYQDTRHNIGFILLDYFSKKNNINFSASQYDYYVAEGIIDNSGFVLVKPTTYVNLSGIAALDLLNEFKLNPEDLLVVHDDLNLNSGQVKIKQSGGDGGHNGISSIIYHLTTNRFPRLRIGIGRDFQQGEMTDYVLSRFTSEDFTFLEPSIKFACDLIEEFIKGGIQSSLNFYSQILKSSQDQTGTGNPNKESN
jgi:PTH1 family peptidyl-tRNA hydrolase